MAFTAAMDLTDLQQAKRQTKTIDGKKILFIWHEDKVHAVDAQCPHLKMPLAKGEINERCELVCPFHHSAFDLNSGEVKCWSSWPPLLGTLLGKLSKPKNLHIYPTRMDGDQIFVDTQV